MTAHAATPDMTLELFAQPRLLAPVRTMIGSFAARSGFDEVTCGQISLCIDEALCNIINHGYGRDPSGRIWLSIWAVGEPKPGIRVVIEDRARQVEPDEIRSRDLDDIRPGGLGVYIIREIMDEVHYEKRSGGGMRMTLIKHAAANAGRVAGTAAQGCSKSEGRQA